jgi:hypothetical protein
VPVLLPTPTRIFIPDNPVTKGDVTFKEMGLKPVYTVHASWIDTKRKDYSVALSKYSGSDPGPNADTTAPEFTFNDVKPGRWYINLKSKIGNQWSKVTYFTVDIPPWTLPTPTLTPTSTSTPTPTVAVNDVQMKEVLGASNDNPELNIWDKIMHFISTFFSSL